MTYFANYDPETGVILGFYTEEIHGSNIPSPNLAISEIQWQDCLAKQGEYKIIGSELVHTPPPAPTEEELLAKAVAAKKEELSEACAIAITGGFVSEAMGAKYQYDSTSEDQFNLSAMYQASLLPTFDTAEPYKGSVPIRACKVAKDGTLGDKEVLLHNKVQITTMFTDLCLHIGSQKQHLWEKQEILKSCETPEEVSLIEW